MMAAIILDLDGTTFKWGTNIFLTGAQERIQKLYDDGNQLIFVTRRDQGRWNLVADPELLLKSLFPNCLVLFGIQSPRIVINDEGAMAINHPRDAAWDYDF